MEWERRANAAPLAVRSVGRRGTSTEVALPTSTAETDRFLASIYSPWFRQLNRCRASLAAYIDRLSLKVQLSIALTVILSVYGVKLSVYTSYFSFQFIPTLCCGGAGSRRETAVEGVALSGHVDKEFWRLEARAVFLLQPPAQIDEAFGAQHVDVGERAAGERREAEPKN